MSVIVEDFDSSVVFSKGEGDDVVKVTLSKEDLPLVAVVVQALDKKRTPKGAARAASSKLTKIGYAVREKTRRDSDVLRVAESLASYGMLTKKVSENKMFTYFEPNAEFDSEVGDSVKEKAAGAFREKVKAVAKDKASKPASKRSGRPRKTASQEDFEALVKRVEALEAALAGTESNEDAKASGSDSEASEADTSEVAEVTEDSEDEAEGEEITDLSECSPETLALLAACEGEDEDDEAVNG